MPLQRLLPQVQRHTYIVAVILLLSKIILTYSYYANKKLVYITIAAPSSCQLFSYSKCTSANIRSSYDIRSVSNAKYIFYIRRCLHSSHFSGGNT